VTVAVKVCVAPARILATVGDTETLTAAPGVDWELFAGADEVLPQPDWIAVLRQRSSRASRRKDFSG
jgi:hypothetical protein